MHNDLREWIERAERMGNLVRISGAHWEKEMAALAELFCHKKRLETPALLFDEIPGYKKGHRVLFHELIAPWAVALTMDFSPEYDSLIDLVKVVHRKIEGLSPVATKKVTGGPVLENIHQGKDVNLLEFPVPLFSEFDGGRYIGTSDCVIMKDPDGDWINLGTYRMQLHDEQSAGLYISPGKHGRLIRQKYFERGLPCPVAVCLGHDPLISLFAGNEVPYGTGEYELIGGVRGKPVEVIEGPETGLPIPAYADIVIEGFCFPGDNKAEGPFPEWTGYFGSSSRAEPVMRVKAVMHRNDPILTARHEIRHKSFDFRSLMRSALLWKELETAGIPEIKGVWRYEQAGTRYFNVISIKQRYYGHARQVLHVAAQTTAGAYAGRWVVVVDDDIDPANMDEVLWAMGTRCQPSMDIEFINRSRSTPLDPLCFDKEKNYYTSLALVDACIPFEQKENFPRATGATPEYIQEVSKKWSALFR
ncbi:MAG: UbiD family decarboxylase [Deltaproteobacteria bacterium]|nr:UbiD family decarboxylase [Deltaproteobacteria bacterium]